MSTATRTKTAALDTIDALLARVGQASTKQAEANTEAGGYQGPTTHVTKDVDDHTDDAEEGARSDENTDDVKHDQGSPAVDNTTPGPTGGQDSVQHNIGTNQSATGEDSAVETASAKPGKDDDGYERGSTHPARTDNDSLDGHKYASAADVLKLIKSSQDAGTKLLAKMAVQQGKPPAAMKAGEDGSAKLPPETVSDADSDASNPPPGKGAVNSDGKSESSDKEAGEQLADEAAKQAQAKTARVTAEVSAIIKNAFDMASATADYLDHFQKRSEDDDDDDDDDEGSEGGAPPSAGMESGGAPMGEPAEDPSMSGAEPAGPPMPLGGGEGGDEEAMLMQLLAGGEAMGGDDAAAGMMDAPPAEAGTGMGGPPVDPGMAGAEPGVGGGEDQVAMLAEALAQLGVTPEAFEAKAASVYAQRVVEKNKVKPGRWSPKTAHETQRFSQIQNYVKEILGK